MTEQPGAARFRAACVAAVVTIVAGGGIYRMIAGRYARAAESIPMVQGSLSRLPMTDGTWQGRDDPLEQAIIEATRTDDLINRTYYNPRTRQVVSLYVAYGLRLRDLMPHRPEVCYPTHGWSVEDTSDVNLTLADGTVLPCRILNFRQSGLSYDRVTVLNYYIVDGGIYPDVSALRSEATRVPTGQSYSAQVQIVAGANPLRPDATESVKAFAAAWTPRIRLLMPDRNTDPGDVDGVAVADPDREASAPPAPRDTGGDRARDRAVGTPGD